MSGDAAKIIRVIAASSCNFQERVSHPGRLIALSTERYRSEIWRIGLDEKPLARYGSYEVIVAPLLEGDDATEGHVPSRVDSKFGEGKRARIAMQDTHYSRRASLANHCARVLLCVARMDDEGLRGFRSKPELGPKRSHLRAARGVVVVVVEPALTDGDGSVLQESAKQRDIATGIKGNGVVRVHARRREGETWIVVRDRRSGGCRFEGLANADDRQRARIPGAGNYLVAVAGERRVREVGVAVDEDWRAPVCRGHLRSIQSSTGAAT